MKFERTESFKRDCRRLGPQLDEFKRVVVEEFAPALERFVANPGQGWPPSLRVKGVAGAPGVWEMTWSFSDPDGRATWEWIKINGETAIRWRRVGDHSIFADP